MAPILPGSIIHSNNVNHAEMVVAMMQNPEWQNLGLTSEAGATTVKLLLCQLQKVSLEVAPPSLTPAPDAQTLNMEADAEAKRKAEEADVSTGESTDQEEKKEVDSLNNREGDKPLGKKRVKRNTNKSSSSSKGQGKGQ